MTESNNKISLTLPIPPTDNRYYGKPRGRRHKYLTKSAKVFRHEVAVIAMNENVRGHFGQSKVYMKAELHLASGGDILNRMKGLCDALQYAEVFDDDVQIDRALVIRGHRVKGGRCDVTLWEK